MITSFEVGSIFKLIDEASPTLRKILGEMRKLREAIDAAKLDLSEFTKAIAPAIGGAAKETDGLTAAWGRVGEAAKAASATIVKAAETAKGATAAATAGLVGGGGGNRGMFRPGARGGGGFRGGPHFGSSGMGLAAIGAWGIDEEAKLESSFPGLQYHTVQPNTPQVNRQFREAIQDVMAKTGYGVSEVAEAFTNDARLMRGAPGAKGDLATQLETAKAIIMGAATEAELKPGTSLNEAVTAIIKDAHLTGAYSPEAIKKLMPVFAYLSMSNDQRLGQMVNAQSYAVPMLSSGMNMDPLDVMLAGTVLSTGGATSSKSGTWLRTLFQKSLDPKNTSSPEWRKLGLVDSHNRPTFVHNGVPSLTEFLTTISEHLAHMPLMEKMALFKRFGERGGSALGMLAQPFMLDRFHNLKSEMQNPDTIANWQHFQERFNAQSPIQKFRLAMQDFNIALMEITKDVMPSVTGALKDFDGAIKHIKGVLPGGETKNDGTVGKRAIEGALAGLTYGAFGGPGGMAGGVLGGAAIGGIEGIAEQYMKNKETSPDRFITGNSAALDASRGTHGGLGWGKAPVVHLNLNIDGRTLADVVSEHQVQSSTYQTNSPTPNGAAIYGP